MTTQSKHTPAPWEIRGDKIVHYLSDQRGVLIVCKISHEGERHLGDNSLIVAAPELLEALEAIASFQADGDYSQTDWKAQVYHTKDIARAAIAKARGQA